MVIMALRLFSLTARRWNSINLCSLASFLLFGDKPEVMVERNKRSFINSSGLVDVVSGARVLDVAVTRGTLPLDSADDEEDGIAADCSEDTPVFDDVPPEAQGIAADCSGDTPDSCDVEVEVQGTAADCSGGTQAFSWVDISSGMAGSDGVSADLRSRFSSAFDFSRRSFLSFFFVSFIFLEDTWGFFRFQTSKVLSEPEVSSSHPWDGEATSSSPHAWGEGLSVTSFGGLPCFSSPPSIPEKRRSIFSWCNMDRPEFSYSTIHGATHARGAEFTPIDRTFTPAATSRNYDFRGMNQDYDPRTSYYRSRGEEFRTPNSKLPTYDGSLSWDPFIFQFENIASRSGWFDDGVKKGRLLECLRGDALQHYMYVAQEGSYEHVKSKMRQLYQIDMTPTTARINARELKQTEDESEEAFAKRLYKVIRMGYLHMGEVAMNQIAIDVFIQGCRNSEAKRAVLKDDPCNLSDAIQAMKQAIAADNIVTGKTRKDSAKQKSTEYSVKQTVVEEETQEEDCDDELSAKQVRFQKKSFREQPTPPRKQAQQVVASTSSERSGNQQSSRPSRDAQPLLRVEDFQQVLRQELAGMLKDMRSSFSKDAESKTPSSRPPNNPSSPSKNSSGSPARLSRPFYCYGCGDFGHYKFSCPYASPGGTTRLPPRQPQPLNSQGQGSKTTNS